MTSTYAGVRVLFLRALAAIYLIAFLSLWPQVLGLVGHQGILPVDQLMDFARQRIGGRFWLLPTLTWFNSSDAFLKFLCGGGAAMAILSFFDLAPAWLFFGQWLFYLSLATVGREFMSFQWDALLLEAGFLAIFFAPARVGRGGETDSEPSPWILFLFRWLLFRLMFQSALVKWLSGDPTWHHFTALNYYYETQPIPSFISWYVQHAPPLYHRISVALTFFVEGAVPFLIFVSRRSRIAVFWAFVAFQAMILVTGNYGFFNWLTIALSLLLLDDQALPWTPAKRKGWNPSAFVKAVHRWVAIVVITISLLKFGAMFRIRWPALAYDTIDAFEGIVPVNNYGLFAVMTTRRPEIIVEGSLDGKEWRTYEFRYKPQDLSRRPPIVEPYMPRLDWLMWFAALEPYQDAKWFIRFAGCLIAGSKPVLALMRTNPFPGAPPRYIRARVYEYHFTTWDEHRKTGAWWNREFKGEYCPIISYRASPSQP